MADDSGPWSLRDFALHHAGPDLARRVPACLRYLHIDADGLDVRVIQVVAERVKRAGIVRVGDLRAHREAALGHIAIRLRHAAMRRREAIVAILKRQLISGAYTITGSVGGHRRTLSIDDVAALDMDFGQSALIGAGLRFDAVAITRTVPVERAPRGSAGRPAEYDWEAFAVWLGATVFKDGFPRTKAEFLRKAQQWFVDTQGREPSESVLKERLNRFYDACEVGRKS